ncbi:MAG: hypothetical protein SNJ71_04745 [Bacteroidales bacterium]
MRPLTPNIIIYKDQIHKNLDNFCNKLKFKTEEIFYPIKVNNNPEVISLLDKAKCRFEAASINEIQLLLNCGIDPSVILYGNPVKSNHDIITAHNLGINLYVADSFKEIQKLSLFAPNSNIIVRIEVSNEGASWKLTEKFGCSDDEAKLIFEEATNKNLNPLGFSFHVGWNNKSIKNWEKVMLHAENLRIKLNKSGRRIQVIDIGGGFPAHDEDSEIYFEEISQKILPYLNHWRNSGIKVIAEPGSYLMANAGFLYSSVIEKIKRKEKYWIFLDTGIFQGFYWILGGLKYKIKNESIKNTGELTEFFITGPTCDSFDIFEKNAFLPAQTDVGDIISISPAGAYIHSAQNYNGFEYPPEIVR